MRSSSGCRRSARVGPRTTLHIRYFYALPRVDLGRTGQAGYTRTDVPSRAEQQCHEVAFSRGDSDAEEPGKDWPLAIVL